MWWRENSRWGAEAPNSKSQAPKNFQKGKTQNTNKGFYSLKFEDWNFFGACFFVI
jgi:hypothetical protein